MKIVTFQGGLGNQLFQYVFYLWLDMRCDKDNIYGYYPKKGLRAHNGLEIEKVFEVKLPNSSLSTDLIVKSIKLINKILKTDNIYQQMGVWMSMVYYLRGFGRINVFGRMLILY
ncbi:hypothetical protein OWT79_02885 [Bacteroides fragilis]|nr:hypothetical protein [Bacteroides fragilis]